MPKSDRGRFSAKRKRETVLRLLRGEDLDLVSREVGVNGSTLAKWREAWAHCGPGNAMTATNPSTSWSASSAK